jgi:hypothetical protein
VENYQWEADLAHSHAELLKSRIRAEALSLHASHLPGRRRRRCSQETFEKPLFPKVPHISKFYSLVCYNL